VIREYPVRLTTKTEGRMATKKHKVHKRRQKAEERPQINAENREIRQKREF
jgi:hypothetical protein